MHLNGSFGHVLVKLRRHVPRLTNEKFKHILFVKYPTEGVRHKNILPMKSSLLKKHTKQYFYVHAHTELTFSKSIIKKLTKIK